LRPLVPVIVTEYSPAVELEHVNAAVAGEGGIERLDGFVEQLTAAGAEIERFTFPPAPFVENAVTAKLAVDPALTVWVAGLAVKLKSRGFTNVTDVLPDAYPVAVAVIVADPAELDVAVIEHAPPVPVVHVEADRVPRVVDREIGTLA
jgi:hypothetical protein